MTAQTATNGKQNGVVGAGDAGISGTPRFWRKLQINEWTFSLFLFALSLAIVAGKILVNYGHVGRWSTNVRGATPSLPAFSHVYNVFAAPNFQESSPSFGEEKLRATSERLLNASRDYGDAMAGAVAGISNRFGRLLRAASCGLAMMGFTWFIIYKDSSVPGVNPPLPFSPSKKLYPEKPRLQINYLVGALNGALIFVYMCL